MLLRALSILGVVLVGVGFALLAAQPSLGVSRLTFAESLPGFVPAGSPASTPTPGPTSRPVATRTPTAQLSATLPASLPSATPVRAPTPTARPAQTPLPSPPLPTPVQAPTPTALPTDTLLPTASPTPPPPSSPTPTPTLPVCPTATSVRPLSVAPKPVATPTPSPSIPVCRTPTPTATAIPRIAGIAPLGLAALDLFLPLWFAQTPLGTNLQLNLAYPRQIVVDTSDIITLTIVRSPDGSVDTITQTPNIVNLAATPLPLGTPGVPILEARGRNYDVFAAAAVSSSDLQIDSSPLSEEQPLDQRTSSWSWSVKPKLAGSNRHAHLVVELRYRPRPDSQGSAYARSVWVQEMSIDVREKDVLGFGPVQIPTASLGTALVQAGISSQVPLLIAWAKRKLTRGSERPPTERPPTRKKKKPTP